MTTCSLTLYVEIDPLIERLIKRTIVALDRAQLNESIQLVTERVDERLFALTKEDGQYVVRLKPFAELALHQTIAISGDRTIDSGMKSRRIAETFVLAGLAARS